MNTREVAEYLGLKERKIYDLVSRREIPCTRVTGKWLFHRDLIDRWLLEHAEGLGTTATTPPAIVAGSHDPLLDWAVRESGSGLALLFNGSSDGLERFGRGEALACGMHVPDPDRQDFNLALIRESLPRQPLVALEWAWREQGLILPPGNPRGLKRITDVQGLRFALRQPGAGSRILLAQLLAAEGLALEAVQAAGPDQRGETEVGIMVAGGDADAGLAIRAVARQLGLDFLPLTRERYDLVVGRRDYFQEAFQCLLAFTRTPGFQEQAAQLTGYDISGLGTVRYNGP